MILFHDVDGCLNAEDGVALPMDRGNFTELQQLRLAELGQHVDASAVQWLAINTGRGLADTETLVPLINARKLRFLIVEHGAHILDLHQNQTISWLGQSAEHLTHINRVIEWFEQSGMSLFEERVQLSLRTLDKMANLTIDVPRDVDAHWLFRELQAFVRDVSPFDHHSLVFHLSEGDGYIDIMSPIDKGDGVNRIMELANSDRSVAVGNGLNDLSMMQVADLGICPANSESELIDCVSARNGIVSPFNYIHATLDWLQSGPART